MPNKFIFATLFVLLSSTSAFADGYFKGGLLYQSDKSATEGSTGGTNRQLLELGAGYLDDKGWMYGLMQSTDTYSSNSGGGSASRTAMGPSIGWMSSKENGPYGMFTYFYTATMDTMTGSGFQIDVGYKFAVRKLAFGFQLSKKQITFDKSGGAAMSPKYIEDKIDPTFVMIVTF